MPNEAPIAAPDQPAASAPARFEDLGLSDEVLAAVHDLGYEIPTPVQAETIPHVLAGRDVLAAAQTGTGKTAAFLLPTMSQLGRVLPHGAPRRHSRGRGPTMLVITPTRELAQQIEDVCVQIAARTGHLAVTVVGGVGYNPQRSALKAGCDILVATPGRLVDLIGEGTCSLSEVHVLVLDEADRMLDMGFLPDVRKIVATTPDDRQTLLFSATLDEKAVGGIADLVRDPVRVEVAPPKSTADTVDQYVLPVSLEAKNALLAQVLKREGAERVIVFTRTKHRADACCRRLGRKGIKAAPIHGNRTQAQREHALKEFREGTVDVLVATDVLARGIDIPDVRYVVNFDVPGEPTDYIHRIGRTGRAGEVGWSLTFVTPEDVDEFYTIEALMGKTADLYDEGLLDVGAVPPVIDPDRVPGSVKGAGTSRAGSKKRRRARAGSAVRKNAPKQQASQKSARVDAKDGARPQRNDRSGQKGSARMQPGDRTEQQDSPRKNSGERTGQQGGTRTKRGNRTESQNEARKQRGGDARSRRRRNASRHNATAQAVEHDWRNSDLPEERRGGSGRTARGANSRNQGSRRAAGSGQRTRRPGDHGGARRSR